MQMDKLRGLLGVRRMDIVSNVQIRELCGVVKGVDERIYESVLHWLSHIERIKNDSIAKRVYVGEQVGSRLTG